jgi:hypothetical protein
MASGTTSAAMVSICATCLDAGIVHPAGIADHIVPHRGDVNASS